MPPPTPEQLARGAIDSQLRASGWHVQSVPERNLAAGRGVAVRELQSQGGPADSLLVA